MDNAPDRADKPSFLGNLVGGVIQLVSWCVLIIILAAFAGLSANLAVEAFNLGYNLF